MSESPAMSRQAIENRRMELTSSVAMTFVMVSFSMVFATLMLGYFSYRFTSDVWPPMGMQRIDLALPTISTVLILLSSMTYYLFEGSHEVKDTKKTNIFYAVTFAIGLAFMGCQTYLWWSLKKHGVFVDTSTFASMIYGFTWIHAAHVIGGFVALLALIPSIAGKRPHVQSALWVKNIGIYWHFLGVVWVIMYFSLFVY